MANAIFSDVKYYFEKPKCVVYYASKCINKFKQLSLKLMCNGQIGT